MVWEYNQLPTHDSTIVHRDMVPVDSHSKEAKILIEYTQGVLNALKLDDGPTHGEVVLRDNVPCLAEKNCGRMAGTGPGCRWPKCCAATPSPLLPWTRVRS